MKPLRAAALGGILLLLQTAVLAVSLGAGSLLFGVLPREIRYASLPLLGDLGPDFQLDETVQALVAFWLAALLPVLGARRLLPVESRGAVRTPVFLGAFWAIFLAFLWGVQRVWLGPDGCALWRDWDSYPAPYPLRELPLRGILPLAGAFLAWPLGWGAHLAPKLEVAACVRALAGVLRRLRPWGFRAARVVLLLLPVAWLAQAWWAREFGQREHAALQRVLLQPTRRLTQPTVDTQWMLQEWKSAPFWGGWNWSLSRRGQCWWPRRAHWECLKLVSGQDLPNDPEAWEGWTQAHPQLVWDPSRRRWVDPP